MSFEIRERDLLARIGRLKTKSGIVETPLLLPVVHPLFQPIPPDKIRDMVGSPALMTNAYLLKQHLKNELNDIHSFLNFKDVVMTDSGGYQILVYGDVETTPEEIVRYQEEIDTDIATILDVPTGWEVPENYARYTVDETLRRAREFSRIKTRDDIIWVGPVQGGAYLELVARSAKEIGSLPFQIHALGSPTPVMKHYLFNILVDMIITAKSNLPLERPLHLFGAGHPIMFALAIALGCDLFDSAAYVLYARKGRYMTNYGTVRLNELRYFPCSCPTCTKNEPKRLMAAPKEERLKMLIQHNLHISFSEINRVKQAIIDGRLCEYLELRAHGHPSLLQALKKLKKFSEYFERQSPVKKSSGLFFFGSSGLFRPEVFRHEKRLFERYSSPRKSKILVLLPQTQMKPFHRSREHRRILTEIQQKIGPLTEKIHICTYSAPFGVVPKELNEVYPLSQYQIAIPFDDETITYTAKQVANYIIANSYTVVIILQDIDTWKGKILIACRQACEKKAISLLTVQGETPWDKKSLNCLITAIRDAL